MNKLAIIETTSRKPKIPQIQPGDTVKVHQIIREGRKRNQVFEGIVIRVSKLGSITASILVRKIASGVGVEKSWFLNSPNITKIEIVKRSKVRRAFLSYLRARRGKSARLAETDFDKEAVNVEDEQPKEIIAKTKKDIDESQLVKESTDDLAKEENKEAAADQPEKDAEAANDEQRLAAEETEEGIEKAEDEVKNK